MPKESFALESDGPRRLEIHWEGGWFYPQKNIRIFLDSQEVGTFATRAELLSSKEITLTNQIKLTIKLVGGNFHITYNGLVVDKIEHPRLTFLSLIANFQAWAGVNFLYALLGAFTVFRVKNPITIPVLIVCGVLLLSLSFLSKHPSKTIFILGSLLVLLSIAFLQFSEGSFSLSLSLAAIHVLVMALDAIRLLRKRTSQSTSA